MCHAKLLHGHVVQFPPIRAEDVFNDITILCITCVLEVVSNEGGKKINWILNTELSGGMKANIRE